MRKNKKTILYYLFFTFTMSIMSTEKFDNPSNILPPGFVPGGPLVGFSGAGVNAQFARPGEDVKAKLDELTLEHSMRGIQVVNTFTTGPVQRPPR